ncbi:hypothetical protein CWO89_21590 [Bradyrhizobium sp. Leo170]|nr:hypothetical protein CWO89_21590 [Bradyrhizobium sp. Leo170]
MKKVLLVAIGILLAPPPAYSQGRTDSGDRHSSYGTRDHDLDEILGGPGDEGFARRMRRGSGFGFFMRAGDATIAVRCDPNDSMKACVEATTTLIEKARSSVPSTGTPSPSPGTSPSRP